MASKAQHTPGPWASNGCGVTAWTGPAHDDAGNRLEKNCRCIAIAHPNPAADDGSMAANARLIASAPDLLIALEDFDNWFCGFDPDDQASRMAGRKVVIRAREAIAKARGVAA